MEKTLDTEKIYNTIKTIVFNTLINDYALERVAFGFEKPGDTVPVDLYLAYLRVALNDGIHKRSDIYGFYIDEQERISTEYDFREFVRDLFVYQMESIFADAPKDARLEHDGEDIPLAPRFREYLFGLLPLFTEVLETEVEYSVFDIIPTDNKIRVAEYDKWQKFVTAILLKPLRSGSQINRYVKGITNAPHYIRMLIEKKGKSFYLKPVDIESHEYIFALFSVMNFMNDEHGKILELKMLEWERRHRAEYAGVQGYNKK